MHSDLLNSWKDIAAYLGRGVRTVQRWEAELNLPVRRPYLRKRSTVCALKSELDEWLRNTGRTTNGNAGSSAEGVATTAILKTNRQQMRMLSTRLRAQMQRTRVLLREARELVSKRASPADLAL